MMYLLAFAIAVGIVCALICAGGNIFDTYEDDDENKGK